MMSKPKRQRQAVQFGDVGARWLEMASNLEAFSNCVSNPAWDGNTDDIIPRASLPVMWEEVCDDDHAHEDIWRHELVWCQRQDGLEFAIHRFSLRDSNTFPLNVLSASARQEMVDAKGEDADDTASNIGGFHGARDAWWREDVARCSQHIGNAVRLAATQEAKALRRPVITASPDECWFNVLGSGAWNCLHTHPGAAYSGVFYVDGGTASTGAEVTTGAAAVTADGMDGALPGRLALVYESPAELPDYHRVHCRPHHLNTGSEAPAARSDVVRPAMTHVLGAQVLLIDPIPGTCVVFPSFVPHCVLPARLPAAATGESAVVATEGVGKDPEASVPSAMVPLRVSLAFNFGSCDPVIANVYTLPGPRVKLLLETVPIYGLSSTAEGREGSESDE